MPSDHSAAIRFWKTGGPDVLALEDVPLHPLRNGEVRVRHEAIGVNFVDTYYRAGLYECPCRRVWEAKPPALSRLLGRV